MIIFFIFFPFSHGFFLYLFLVCFPVDLRVSDNNLFLFNIDAPNIDAEPAAGISLAEVDFGIEYDRMELKNSS